MNKNFFDIYFEDIVNKISLVYKDFKDDLELVERLRNKLLDKIIEKPLQINNNYTQSKMNTTNVKLLNILFKKKPLISGYGVLFHNSETIENIPGKIIKYLLSQRKVAKKIMLSHVNDEDKSYYNMYDLTQSSLKLLANSWYGAMGEQGFHFFNPYLGPSTTYTGQHIIASAITGFEGLISNNYIFENFNELIYFISNCDKLVMKEEFTFNTKVSTDDLIEKFYKKCQFEITDSQLEILEGIFDNMDDLKKENIFFKNDLMLLLSQSSMKKLLKKLFTNSFLNPENPPEDIVENLKFFNEYVTYFVAYKFQYPNKIHKSRTMERETILVTDTDSTFVYLDPLVKVMKGVVKQNSYDQEETTSIVNVFTYLLTHFIESVFYELSTNYNVEVKNRSMISMKNEFLFERVVLTENKKQYAAKMLMKEGNIFKKPKYEVKGLSIKKVGTPKPARIIYNKILEDLILNPKEIDRMAVFKEFVKLEKMVEGSLNKCETKFLKPSKFSSVNAYADPLTQQAVRGVLLWNAIYPDKAIQNLSKINILKFKSVDVATLDRYLPKEIIDKINDNYFSMTFKNSKKEIKDYGIEVLAIPKDLEYFPKEFVKLMNEIEITNDIIKVGNILLESIGFNIVKSFTYEVASNTISF